MSRARTIIALALVIIAGAVAGCGGGSSEPSGDAVEYCDQLRADLGPENVEPDCEAEFDAGEELD